VLADRDPPLLALVRPAATDLEAALGEPGARRGQRETARVQRDERDLEALPLLADDVLARDVHVL